MKPLLITALCCGWLTNYAQSTYQSEDMSVQLQVDAQSHRDTLEIFHRMGEGGLAFAEVKILAFASQRKHSRIRYERGFAEFVLHRLSLRPSSVSSF